jgi:L-amino acid N-acyltransferase YncA
VALCTRRHQFARLQASRGMSADEVRRRLVNQMQPAQMTAQAQRVIRTDGTTAETAQTVLAAWVGLGLPLPAPVIRRAALADCEGTAAVLNSVVREGGRTITGRTFTPAQERAFFRSMPKRAFLNIVLLGRVVVGFQSVEPYATFTHTMDHVASVGTHLLAAVRGRGLGHALSAVTWAEARAAGFNKLVIAVREDNPQAQAFYAGLGFQPCGRLTRQAFVDDKFVDELLYEIFLEEGS